jgi:hypothetical protein
MTFLPEVIQAVHEQLRCDIGLLLSAETIDRFTSARLAIYLAITDFHDELEFYQWAVEVILLNFSFASTSWDVRMKKGIKVLLQRSQRKAAVVLLGLFLDCLQGCTGDKLGFLPPIKEVVPSQEGIMHIGREIPVYEPQCSDIFQERIESVLS